MTPSHRTPTTLSNNAGFLALALALLSLATLGGCGTTRSGQYFENDGPGKATLDPATITDAVPKREPRAARGNRPYAVYGKTYVPLADARGYRERGVASWYGKQFHGRSTSSGEPYDMYSMTAAHRTLPLPTYVRVRNLQNGRTIVVRVNDRGPFLHNRVIDLSYAAATKLGIVGTGTGLVEVETIMPGEETPTLVAQESAPKDSTQTRGIGVVASAEAAPLPPLASTAPAATSAAPAQPALTPPKMFVQVGAYREWSNAEAMRQRLERAAFGPIMVQSVAADSQTRLFRVRIGPVASVEEGDRLTEALSREGVRDPLIIVE